MSAICNSEGQLPRVVGTLHDIGCQKQQESRLLDLNAELDECVRDAIEKKRESDQLLQQ